MAYNSKYTGQEVEDLLDKIDKYDLSTFVDLSSAQTITGIKSFDTDFKVLTNTTSALSSKNILFANGNNIYARIGANTQGDLGFYGSHSFFLRPSFTDTTKGVVITATSFTFNNNNVALQKDIPSIPTNISTFTNDAGYLVAKDISGKADASNVYTKQEIDDIIGDIELALSKL